jgi:ribonuclease HII
MTQESKAVRKETATRRIEQPVVNREGLRIAGVDEAGRGPLAGPVVAAAVILDPENIPAGLDDSKRLSESQRNTAFEAILSQASAISFALLPPAEIDRLNIRGATLEAMRRAVAGLNIAPDLVLVDGRDIPHGLPCAAHAIIGGDATEAVISAASIVAKVMRDRLMTRLGDHFPAYGFAIHKGYGTLRHRLAISQTGGSPHHRQSFAPFKNGTHAK